MEVVAKAQDAFRSFSEKHLSGLRPVGEFRARILHWAPRDQLLALQASQRDNMESAERGDGGGPGTWLMSVRPQADLAPVQHERGHPAPHLQHAPVLGLTNPFLLIAIAFFGCGFYAINRFGPEPLEVGNTVITQKTMYIALFVIGLPMLFIASPFSVFFWLVGSSAILILGHAMLMEPGVESEYTGIESV
ncbi:uncharacterized protein EHS24_004504 [Apiotrichum porosum]|uniref:PRA1 family protein n=1 Tax=Apiotrichum porosum TaxID=105984 RepID=A0A427Y5A4_9TREE|nr:uncharacterized protein EHS24_004504 [Apiotrichum porosum]RSH86266.1 hypothetical protein EHS24_004504 [Apiotrichum porosum]